MTVEQFFSAIAALAGLTFVVASMLGTGLSLTVAQILQPLKNARLVILALLANFVLVPLLAFAITRVVPLDQSLQIGLIVLATTAGAPFLVKEVAAANGNLSLGVGLMFLLMIVTIFYVPIVLPLLLPGVEVNAWDIAKSLIVTMLIPIVLGLMFRSHSPEGAGQWAPVMNKVSGIALLIMLVTGLGLNSLQHHRPDRLVWLPGADPLRRRIAADRHAHGGPRSGRPQRAGAGHGAAQRGRRHPGHQLSISRAP